MLPEYFINNVNCLTSVNIYGETFIDNSLNVSGSLMVGQSSVNVAVLYVDDEKVGINTETPNVELTVVGNISSTGVVYASGGNSNIWNSVYSSYNQNSATYATQNYVQNNFLALTGGTVTGDTQFNKNVTIWGVLSATGGTYFANTIYSTTSALSVIHVGSGPALYVGSTGTGDIASFYDLDDNVEMLHIGGHDGDYPNVGIKTSTPNVDFTVNGEISSSEIIYDANGNSNQWNSVYTTVNSNSPEWDSVYTTVQEKSATEWDNTLSNQYTHLNFLPLSGGTITDKLTVVGNISCNGFLYGNGSNLTGIVAGDTVATTLVRTNSANWDSVYSSVNAASANWDTVYSSVSNTSANWDSVYTSVKGTSANWDSAYSNFSNNSSNYIKQNGNSFNTRAIVGTIDNNDFSINTNNTEKMRIFSNGNVAYDDFSNLPGAAGNSTYKVMHYASPTNAGSTMLSMASKFSHTVFFGNLGGSTGGFVIGSEGTDKSISFKQGLTYSDSNTLGTGTTVMSIAGNGNVGINTTTPNEKLTVVGNISATQDYFSGSNKSVFTPQTNTVGVSAISNIVAVSALPVSPDPSTLYIVI